MTTHGRVATAGGEGVGVCIVDMDRETFNNWLASYRSAWTNRDPEAAASLYADDATYQVTPFDEPLRGRAAIYEYWAGVAKTEEKIQFDY